MRNGASAASASAASATSATPVTSSTGSATSVGVGLGQRDDLDGVGDRRVRLVQPGHHLVEVVEGVGVHGLGDVARCRHRAEVEAGHHAEEPRPRAAGRPVEVAVLLGVGADQLAVRGHHVDRLDVLRGPAPAAAVPALPALEQEAADADGGAVPAGEEPPALGEVRRQLGAALDGRRGADDAGDVVVRQLAEPAEVDDQGVVRGPTTAPSCGRRTGPPPASRAPGPAGRRARRRARSRP